MVVGNGMKANRFMEYALKDEYLVFAADVTNSQETDSGVFSSEEQSVLSLIQQNPDKIFIYFSTASIYDPSSISSMYVQHKLKIEALITEKATRYLIFRPTQIVGLSRNRKTLFNFLVDAIQEGSEFSIWENATRNFIDVDDLFFFVDQILKKNLYCNRIINLANPISMNLIDVVNEIEIHLQKKATLKIEKKGHRYEVDIPEVKLLISELGTLFGPAYFKLLLKKYAPILGAPKKKISIVVPTYFEEKGIHEFYRRTKNVLTSIGSRFEHEIIFVNDGSTDRTLEKLLELVELDKNVKVINFARNFGNQIAITAGLKKAVGDIVVIIDDDLQDPPEVILNFIAKWDEGYKVVYGYRTKRKGVNVVFRAIANLFYRFVQNISDVKIPLDTGDFRLIDRVVANNLMLVSEENRYFRGLVSWVGFSQIGWAYERDARFAGQTTFTLKKYIYFAFDGITSFSEKPLYFSSYLGFLITLLGFISAIWIVISKFLDPSSSIRGWPSLVAIILFFGGIQLLSIGIVGLYIGKIHKEVKRRPLYITENEYGF